MKLTAQTNWGPFEYTATAEFPVEVPDNQRVKDFLVEGILSKCFRAAGSKVQKGMVDGGHLAAEASRKDTKYNDQSVADFTELMNEALEEEKVEVVVTGRYEPGEAAQSRKRAQAMYDDAMSKDAAGQKMFAELFLGGKELTVENVHERFFKTEKKGKK